MSSLGDIGVSAAINIASAFVFLLAFALLRIQPINERIYFHKLYITGKRRSTDAQEGCARYVSLDARTYFTFLNWIPGALKMSQTDLINHAGLDSVVYLRIYILGLKIFIPIAILALLIIVPVNFSGGTLFSLRTEIVYNDIDKLSISNVNAGSQRFWIHMLMEYFLTFWTLYILYKEYANVSSMRLNFLASQVRHADQFTVVVRNIPPVDGQSISATVEQFFRRNYPNHYLGHQAVYNANKLAKLVAKKERLQNWLDYYTLKFSKHQVMRPTKKVGSLGSRGKRVDAIEYYEKKIIELDKQIASERERVLSNHAAIMPVAFVTFNSRWGAAVCAQTQQSRDPTQWLTDWAPEPRDVYWRNLAIPFISLRIRRFIISVAVFALVFFYIIPVTFVQSLANLESLERFAPFLRPIVEQKVLKSFLQGYLPGLASKIFEYFLPAVLMIMSKVEGYISRSSLDRRAAAKFYYYKLVSFFLGSIVTGTAVEQLNSFLHQSPTEIPRTIGVSIPMKATFFITYIMVDGWASIALEILRLKTLVLYHLKNMLIVKTERDRDKAVSVGSIALNEKLATVQLYFLLGLVYAVVTPLLLPFILVFFAFAYLVYRHQIINVYNKKYESAGAFWPHVHTRIVASLLISQLLMLGLLSTKKAANSTPLLSILPVLTIWFHIYCKHRFEPAFKKYPLDEAMKKDMLEKAAERDLDLKAYMNPAFNTGINIEIDDRGSPSSPPHSQHSYSNQDLSPPHYVHEEV